MEHLTLRFRALFIVGLLLTVACPVAAQNAGNRFAAVDSVFDRYVRPEGPGCAVGVVIRGELAYASGYGLADVERATPFTPQTVFDTGSTYKQFISAGVLILARQGKLSLDDDIRKFIPEIPDYGARITVRHLLNHTHGLREYLDLTLISSPGLTGSEGARLRLLSRQRKPAAAPGERIFYGNTGPLLARIIIKRVSGQPLGDFTQRHIFGPLGMRSTYLGDESRPVTLRAMGYRRGPNGGLVSVTSGGRSETTIEDLARWSRNLEAPGAEWKGLVRQMRTSSILRSGEMLDYGLNLRLSPYRGLRRVWHPGRANGAVAALMHFPEPRMTIAVGCNNQTLNPIVLAESIADVLLQDEFARAARRAAKTSILPAGSSGVAVSAAALAGTYVSASGNVLRIRLRNGRLYARSEGDEGPMSAKSERGEHEMVPVSPRRFLFPGAPNLPFDPASEAVFEIGPDGKPTVLEIRTNWYPTQYTAVEPADPAAIVRSDYVGSYQSGETESALLVSEREGRLELKTPNALIEMESVSRDLFRAGRFLVRFTRQGGRVMALNVTIGGVRDLQFESQSQ
jgi:CubicO group peptidase (beta-lactamase class C family)